MKIIAEKYIKDELYKVGEMQAKGCIVTENSLEGLDYLSQVQKLVLRLLVLFIQENNESNNPLIIKL